MKKLLALTLAWALLFLSLSADVLPVVGALEQLLTEGQSHLVGDITEDGKVNISDVSGLYAHVKGTKRQPDEVAARCDITGDGRVNIGDVSNLYCKIKGVGQPDALQLYAKEIRQAQAPGTLTLSMMSDTHYCGHGLLPQSDKLEAAGDMVKLSHYVKLDALVNLGDFVPGNEEKEKTLEDLKQLVSATGENAKCPVFYVRGNHDDNGWYSRQEDGNPGTGRPEEIIDHDEWYQLAFGSAAGEMVTDSRNPTGGYGYFDHEESKIRVFLLNTSDIPYVLQEDGTYRYHAYECNAFGDAQLNFVARSLMFEDKEAPGEWAAMFLMHVPLDTVSENGYRFGMANTPIRGYIQMLSIIDAYRKGISYSFEGSVNASTTDKVTGELIERPEDFRVSVAADYSAKGGGDVIAFVNGHTHVDNASQKVGYEYSLSYGYTYLSVVGSDTFSTMVINREKGTVTVFQYGRGRGPSQSIDPQINQKGQILVVNGEEEFGINFAEDGQWEIPFDQFRPQGESLLAGQDVVALDGFKLPSMPEPLSLDPDTMLPDTVIESSHYVVSKPVLLKQNTQYVIPDIGKSTVFAFHHKHLTRSGILKPQKLGDEQLLTGKSYTGCYVVFVFSKESYPDYENFYIRERVHSDVPNASS